MSRREEKIAKQLQNAMLSKKRQQEVDEDLSDCVLNLQFA